MLWQRLETVFRIFSKELIKSDNSFVKNTTCYLYKIAKIIASEMS